MTKPLIIPLLLFLNSTYAQTNLDLKPGDTLKYSPQSHKPSWISVQSVGANMGVALFMDGKKLKEQDDSKGIKSIERLYFTPEKGKKYEMKKRIEKEKRI